MRIVVALLLAVALAVPAGADAAAQTSAAEPNRLLYTASAGDSSQWLGRVATMAPDGTDARLLEPPVFTQDPAMSPDGRWIAYSTMSPDPRSVAVVPAGGGEPQVLVSGAGSPAWAPTGDRIAYVAYDGSTHQLVVTDVDTSGSSVVLGQQRVFQLPAAPSPPVFSPSGDAVALRVTRPGEQWVGDLWVAILATRELRRVSDGVGIDVVGAASYSWSPDGAWIAFLAVEADRPGAPVAYLVRPNGSSQRRLSTQTCNYDDALAWEPYGRYLAVVPACSEGIQLVALDGTVLARVGSSDGWWGRGLLFAPDARSLYAMVHQGSAGVVRVPVDGSPQRRLSPLHAPDGMALTFAGPTSRPDPSAMPPLPRTANPPPQDGTTSDPPPQDGTTWDPPPQDGTTSDPSWPEDPAPPPPARRAELAHACGRWRMPPAPVRDVTEGSPFRAPVDCVVWWRVMSPVTPRRFAPDRALTRGQVATLLARVVENSRRRLPVAARDYFADDSTSVHERNINRLRAAGIITTSGRRFGAEARVRRDQMASMLIRAYEYTFRRSAPRPARDHFEDDAASIHHRNINRAAQLELVIGTSRLRYGPGEMLRRRDAALSAARFLDMAVEIRGAAPPTYGEALVTRVVDGDTFIANVQDDNGRTVSGVRVRMAGINAPERGTCGARRAKQALRGSLLNRTVRLSARSALSVGRDNRPIRFVQIWHYGRWYDMSHEVLAWGQALWMPHHKEPGNQRQYSRRAQWAASRGIGMWSPSLCGLGPAQDADLRMSVQSDAPGDDADNLNGEVVRIWNAGAEAVDLSGWKLRDSSLHGAYRLPDATRISPGETLWVHVGAGRDRRLRKFWGSRVPLFDNVRANGTGGDGAYLFDTDGDLRFHHMYPCLVDC